MKITRGILEVIFFKKALSLSSSLVFPARILRNLLIFCGVIFDFTAEISLLSADIIDC
jgi:hypothetical protein